MKHVRATTVTIQPSRSDQPITVEYIGTTGKQVAVKCGDNMIIVRPERLRLALDLVEPA